MNSTIGWILAIALGFPGCNVAIATIAKPFSAGVPVESPRTTPTDSVTVNPPHAPVDRRWLEDGLDGGAE